MTGTAVDVLGIGCAAVDEMLFVGAYPARDDKAEVLRRERHCGGLTATALIAATKLGASCAFAGALGDDDLSRFVLESLAAHGIDLGDLVRRPDARPVHSVVVIDESGSRTLFFSHTGVVAADDHLPDESVIRRAKVLLVDYVGVVGASRAARVARDAGIPVVADVETAGGGSATDLLAVADHPILPLRVAQEVTGRSDPGEVVDALWNDGRDVVVVTAGDRGCWYRARGEPARHQPALPVPLVKDTTGCGDVFHGAYAAALAGGMPVAERVRFASAASAAKAAAGSGPGAVPTSADVDQLLEGVR